MIRLLREGEGRHGICSGCSFGVGFAVSVAMVDLSASKTRTLGGGFERWSLVAGLLGLRFSGLEDGREGLFSQAFDLSDIRRDNDGDEWRPSRSMFGTGLPKSSFVVTTCCIPL